MGTKLKGIKILELAKAINKNNKIKFIGLREGEKIHETLINKESSKNTLEFKNHYIIKPNLKELNYNYETPNKENFFTYDSSNTKHLNKNELNNLLKKYD